MPDAKDALDVPHLTDAYHRARKSYALAAALLMAWELIGINLKDTPYFELVNPQAAPLVLLAVTLYFAARLTLEWLQLDLRRRHHFAARLDYVLAHAIGIGALGLYVVQLTWQIQIASLLLDNQLWPGEKWAFCAGAALSSLVVSWWRGWRDHAITFGFGVFVFLLCVTAAISYGREQATTSVRLFTWAGLGALTWLVYDFGIWVWLLNKLVARAEPRSSPSR